MTQPAIELLTLLSAMDEQDISKMNRSEATVFRKKPAVLFQSAALTLLHSVLASIPDAGAGHKLIFDGGFEREPRDAVIGEAYLIAKSRGQGLIAARAKDEVEEWLERELATLYMELRARSNLQRAPEFSLSLTCSGETTQGLLLSELTAMEGELQDACGGTAQYSVYSEGGTMTHVHEEGGVSATMAQCIKECRREAELNGDECAEPVILKVGMGMDASPVAVVNALRAFVKLYLYVMQEMTRPDPGLTQEAFEVSTAAIHRAKGRDPNAGTSCASM
jgi:hypothetical protein